MAHQGYDDLLDLYADTLKRYLSGFRHFDSPLTLKLALLISFVYLGQQIAALSIGASIPMVTAYYFLEYPAFMWGISFFLHRGILHYLANVLLLIVIGRPAEQNFGRRGYLIFIAISAVLCSAGGYLATAPFTAKAVAVYGASGFVFAIATYSLYYPLHSNNLDRQSQTQSFNLSDIPPTERVSWLFGICVLLLVIFDTATFLSAWFGDLNGGHLVGAVIGIVVGRINPPSNERY